MNGNRWKENNYYKEMKYVENLGLEKAKEIILWQYEQICEKQRQIEERRIILHKHGWKENNNNTTGFEDCPTW